MIRHPRRLARVRRAWLWAHLAVALAALALDACASGPVRAQAAAANTAALAFNRALPVVVAEYEREGRAAIDAACCDAAAMRTALATHQTRWQPVVLGWELARIAHDDWRAALERCRDQPAEVCMPGVERTALTFVDSVVRARCAVRVIGRADLDPLPDPPACGDVPTDGGTQ